MLNRHPEESKDRTPAPAKPEESKAKPGILLRVPTPSWLGLPSWCHPEHRGARSTADRTFAKDLGAGQTPATGRPRARTARGERAPTVSKDEATAPTKAAPRPFTGTNRHSQLRHFILALITLLILLPSSSILHPPPTHAQSAFNVTDGGVESSFPDLLVFRASAESSSAIEKVRLRYKILPDGGAATAEAEFQPGTSVSAVFALQSPDKTTFYLAPGTTIEYQWEVTDAAGNTGFTPVATYFYDDDRFEWSNLEQGGVTIYYYAGGQEDAQAMLDVAFESITRMSALLGGTVDFPVKVWIYDSVDDMRPALPRRSETYEDSVITAGIRITTDTVLVLGEASFDTLRHELTHVVTAASGESALGTLPAWLDEGTAVYSQDDPEGFGGAIEDAIDRGNVLSLRSITSSPGDPSKVNLFYGQSWHIVKYLVDTYGEAKFASLFATIKGGKRIDSALEAVYGFDQDGLEDEWRAANNLPPRQTPEPTEPPAQDEPTNTPAGSNGSQTTDDDGTSATTVIFIAIATLALAGLIALAGLTLARRFK